jgi:DNA-binding MarR family transcriptional regulator
VVPKLNDIWCRNSRTKPVPFIADVQRQLAVFSRRVRAVSAQLHPELPFVAYSMLSHIAATCGSRAVDLAALFQLDKSTVSRQIGDLERQGLIERTPAPPGGRAQLLHVTPAGAAALSEATHRQRTALAQRLVDWEPEEIVDFARLLRRYNGD